MGSSNGIYFKYKHIASSQLLNSSHPLQHEKIKNNPLVATELYSYTSISSNGQIDMFVNNNTNEEFIAQKQSLSLDCMGDVSFTTFNILAPIYKRLNCEKRESEFRDYWLSRNQSILDALLRLKSSIICLQEFWVGNEELVTMYERQLNNAGYASYKLARTNGRGDGLLTAVRRDHFQVLNYKEVLFSDFSDRVAQLLHINLVMFHSQNRTTKVNTESLLVNTHLLFPHNSGCCLHRLLQVYKILQYIESYCKEYQLPPLPIILCGDWNGSKKGYVYKFLRSQGFVSSYDTAHQYTDGDAHKWVSHRNHRGNICGVDFIWLLNPNNPQKPLKESFIEAILGNIKNHLREVSATCTDQIQLKTHFEHNTFITYPQFYEAFIELGFINHPSNGLSIDEIKDLWDYMDTDRDGVVTFSQFNQRKIKEAKAWVDKFHVSTAIGFDVKNAVLFPREVEQGIWPENYSLSDHAHLTVEVSPVMFVK